MNRNPVQVQEEDEEEDEEKERERERRLRSSRNRHTGIAALTSTAHQSPPIARLRQSHLAL